jgi:starch synthase
MNILFVSAEMEPFAKVGGLADVVGALPAALREAGDDARVIMPLYGTINTARYHINYQFTFQLPRRTGTAEVHVFSTVYRGVPIYFLKSWPYFGDEHTVYTDWDWDSPRFIFFSQAALAAADELRAREGWFPEVVNANDWHTGIVPFLVADRRGWRADWEHVGTVMTLHNTAYQGEHLGGWLFDAGVPGRHHWMLDWRGLNDNALAIGVAYADLITTVSPRYAIEIQYPDLGFGLDGLLRDRSGDLYGILNGIDQAQFNPATDTHIASNYTAANFQTQRPPNKTELQREMGLPERADVPLIGLVSRLVYQKGIDLVIPAMRRLLAGYDVQFVALGAGEHGLNDALWQLGNDFSWKARVSIGYNAAVAQHIYAGCDLFLMPSRFEPCGIGQMIAMRYGALPLVRETGGLADTVHNYDGGPADEGTGFVFLWETPDALYHTLVWALETYTNRHDAWLRMQERAMRRDFSWTGSVRQYQRLYAMAAARHAPVEDES